MTFAETYAEARADEYDYARTELAKLDETAWRQWGYRGKFDCYFWFVSKYAISLGVTVHWKNPINLEVHMPFGFVRIGLVSRGERAAREYWAYLRKIVREYEDDTRAERI